MREHVPVPFATRILALPVALVLLMTSACGEEEEGEVGLGALAAEIIEIGDVGLESPRAVIHDPVADMYLVSNVSGGPLEENDSGFISRFSPDGELDQLAWIQTVGPESRLNAPKGMALADASLFVADVQCIRMYDRESGSMSDQRCLGDVTSLVGVDVGPEGSLFVTDSGLDFANGDPITTGTDAVYRLAVEDFSRGATLASGEELGSPMGIAVGARGIFTVTHNSGEVIRLTPGGERTDVLQQPDQRFEGVVFLADGGFAYSSSSHSAVYLVDGAGQLHTLLEDVDAPGDLGYDETRNRLLVPLYNENRLLLVDLDSELDMTMD